MKANNFLLNLPTLDQAINQPIIVAPDTSLLEIIRLMEEPDESLIATHSHICLEEKGLDAGQTQTETSELETDNSCVLVMKASQVIGVFTKRDVVQVVASGKILQNSVKIAEVMTQPVITLHLSNAQDIFAPLLLFRQYRICHLPIVDDRDRLLGTITPASILQALQPINLLKLGTVDEVINTHLACASRTTSVLKIAQLMAEHRVKCVVITEVGGQAAEDNNLAIAPSPYDATTEAYTLHSVGIVTERTIVQALALGIDLAQTPAVSVMRRLGAELNPQHSLLFAYQQMQCEDLQLLLVSERQGENPGKRLGIITAMELLRSLEPVHIYQKLKRAQQSVRQLQVEKTELLQSRNAELEEQVQQRTAQLQAALTKVEQQAKQAALLNQIVQAMRGTLVLDEILQTTANQLHEALNVNCCLIFRPHSQQQPAVRYVSETPFGEQSCLEIACDFSRYYYATLAQGESVVLPRIDASVEPEVQQLANYCNIQALLIVPLIYQQSYIGGISLHDCYQEREWTADDITFVKDIADHCAIAIHQAELYQQLQTELQERQKAETALREQKQFLRTVIDTNPNLIFVKNWQGQFILVNQACADIYGTTIEQMLGKTDADFNSVQTEVEQFSWEDREVMTSLCPKFITEEPITTATREVRWLQTIKKPLLSPDNQVVQVLGVATDITDRKLAEEALRESEKRFRRMADTAPVLIWVAGTDGLCTFVNRTWLRFTGRTLEQELGNGWLTGVHPEDRVRYLETYQSALNHHQSFQIEYCLRNAKGEYRWIFAQGVPRFTPNDSFAGYIGSCMDITELKQAQAERDRFFNNSMDLMVVTDRQGYIRLVNPAWEKNLGFTKEELEGKHYSQFVHPEDLNDTDAIRRPKSDQEPSLIRFENRYLCKHGSYRWLSWNAVVFETEGLVYGFARDITEYKQVEASRRASEARFRALSECSPVGIFMTDAQRFITYTNPRCQTICGFTFAESLGQDWAQFVHPDDRLAIEQNWLNYTQTNQEYCFEHRFLHRDGTRRWVEVRTAKLLLEKNQPIGYVGTVQDITDTKQAKEQIQASLQEKEVLLREVHHRVKNNLQIIYSLLDLQSQQLQDIAIREVFQSSQNRIRFMALIHEHLYQLENMAYVEFADYIETLTNALLQAYAINPDIIILTLDIAPFPLSIDTAIPCGLIINELVSNALKYAFPDQMNGAILVEFKNIDGQFILKVQDNGIGFLNCHINPDEPHLGLNLVRILTQQIKGQIEIEQNQGTTVLIQFK